MVIVDFSQLMLVNLILKHISASLSIMAVRGQLHLNNGVPS